MVDIYLIHAADDAPRVAPILSQIQHESLSLEVKAAGRRGLLGRMGTESLEAHCVLVVITRSADQSGMFVDSWNAAEKSGRTLFVLVLEDSPGLRARYSRGLVITPDALPGLLKIIRTAIPAIPTTPVSDIPEQKKSRGGIFDRLPTPPKQNRQAKSEVGEIDDLLKDVQPPPSKPTRGGDLFGGVQEEPEPESRKRSFQPGGAGVEKGTTDKDKESVRRGIGGGSAVPPPPAPPAPAPRPQPITTPALPAAPPASVAPDARPEPMPEADEAFASEEEVSPPEEVRFTGFSPAKAQVRQWYSLLVYSHVEAALEQVRQDADRFKPYMGGTVREARKSPIAKLQRGAELTLIPHCGGVKFNPERIVFNWLEDIHRADFRFRGESEDLELENITVTVFAGPVSLASLKLGVEFTLDELVTALETAPQQQTAAEIYSASQIFPSYSHDDEPIVIACRNAYKALGYEFLRDRDKLRPGEPWNDRLIAFIDQANIFQLYWSARSAKSEYCRQEWQHALQLVHTGRKPADFIRPVYWDRDAFVNPPPELGNLHFAYVELPRLNS